VISRRLFLVTTGIVMLPGLAVAQAQKVWRIGYIAPGMAHDPAFFQTFMEVLRALGYTEGQNVLIERRAADGRADVLPTLAEELVRAKVDVIVAPTTPVARAAKAATNSIPIVFMAVSDPVGSGLVVSLAHPGGNITGATDMGIDLVGKQLDLLKQVVPHLKRVAALGNPGDTVWELTWGQAQETARQLHIEIFPVLVTTPAELDSAVAGLGRRVQALLVAPQLFFLVHLKKLIEVATLARLPAIYEARVQTVAGGLMSYGPSRRIVVANAARSVDKILKGAKPADLPVEQPTEYELVINLRTAKSLGLTMPESVLLLANEVVR
jgi:putative ABC transport system substrate-binding protein